MSRTVAINGSRPTANHHARRCPRVHLHRVVPGVPSRWIGLTTPSKGILPAHQGRTPPRPARCSRLCGRLTRATTESHRETRPARAASGASTLHQPLRPLRAGLPLGPSPHDAAPTPSLSQWRSELRRPDGGREGLASFVASRIARNGSDQWLAAHGRPSPTTLPASPFASRGSGPTVSWSWPSTLRRIDPTSTWGLPATRDRPPQRDAAPSDSSAMNQIGTNVSAAPLQAA